MSTEYNHKNHASAVDRRNKNPYEVRTDILQIASRVLSNKIELMHSTGAKTSSEIAAIIENFEDRVIDLAKKMNDFVSSSNDKPSRTHHE